MICYHYAVVTHITHDYSYHASLLINTHITQFYSSRAPGRAPTLPPLSQPLAAPGLLRPISGCLEPEAAAGSLAAAAVAYASAVATQNCSNNTLTLILRI